METNADIKLITHREASKSGGVKYGSRKALTEKSHTLRLKKQLQIRNCCHNIFKWQDFT